jgi:tetratricopeptide (TPR) repeat protein
MSQKPAIPSTPFVGRDAELAALIEALRRGTAGKGSVVLVEGGPGLGKSLLVRKLAEEVIRNSTFEGAVVALGHCYEQTGPQNAYQPFTELLDEIARSPVRKHGFFKALGSVVKKTAPDWLQAIPVVGALLGAGAKTATLLLEDRDLAAKADNIARQYADAIVRVAEDERLLVLVVEDCQWIDDPSCELILRLSVQISRLPLVLVLTYRPAEDDRFLRVRSELIVRDATETISLSGLNTDQIGSYIRSRFATVFFDEFPGWLSHLCQGNPLFVTQYLNLLEEEGIIYRTGEEFRVDGSVERRGRTWEVVGRLAEMPLSGDIDTLLERRIQRLLDEEREMLQIGAVQGEYFGSLVLAQISQKQEMAVLAQLRRVSERHRIISLYTGHDWLRDRSEMYAFEHLLMHQAFYRKLGPHERRLYHQEVANVLKKLAAEYEVPPRKLLLDLAYHCRRGGRLLDAAHNYFAAAESSYFDGATAEAAHLCAESLTCLRLLPEGDSERDALTANCVLLHLTFTLYGPVDAAANRELLALAEEGELAAVRADLPSTLARLKGVQGHLYIRLGDVTQALELMRDAVAVARKTADRVTEFFALAQLGKQLAKEDLQESMKVRLEAKSVFDRYVSQAEIPADERAVLERQNAMLVVYIGLGKLDLGEYEQAIELLKAGVSELRVRHMYDDLMAGLNYLGQAYAVVGMFAEAERVVQEAIELRSKYEEDTLHPWIGYDVGLLAKIYLEWGRVTDAIRTMPEAVRISEATKQADLVTLVRNYRAELLMHPHNPAGDLREAEAVLVDNIADSRHAALHRSAALGLSLLSLLKLRELRMGEAVEHGDQALACLRQKGDMPALRTEEVLFNHYRVLLAAGRAAEAEALLEEAHSVLTRKGQRIEDPELRESFYRNVPLSRAITEAAAAHAKTPATGGSDV